LNDECFDVSSQVSPYGGNSGSVVTGSSESGLNLVVDRVKSPVEYTNSNYPGRVNSLSSSSSGASTSSASIVVPPVVTPAEANFAKIAPLLSQGIIHHHQGGMQQQQQQQQQSGHSGHNTTIVTTQSGDRLLMTVSPGQQQHHQKDLDQYDVYGPGSKRTILQPQPGQSVITGNNMHHQERQTLLVQHQSQPPPPPMSHQHDMHIRDREREQITYSTQQGSGQGNVSRNRPGSAMQSDMSPQGRAANELVGHGANKGNGCVVVMGRPEEVQQAGSNNTLPVTMYAPKYGFQTILQVSDSNYPHSP